MGSSVRRERSDFGPDPFQRPAVVADQRKIVFVIKYHEPKKQKKCRLAFFVSDVFRK